MGDHINGGDVVESPFDAPPSQFIQIAVAPGGMTWPARLYALDRNGDLWEFIEGTTGAYWRPLPMLRLLHENR